LDYPFQNITVNLALADIKKEGSGFDLPMAIAGEVPTATGTATGRSSKKWPLNNQVSNTWRV